MKLQNGQTLLFTGDSITDCNRARPTGEGLGLGDGYVSQVDALLATWYPQKLIRVLNTGIGGNRVTDLETRWQTDILDHKPDWLSIMIGINDVWRQFSSVTNPNQVYIERYESTYRKLLEQARPSLKGLVLMTPYFLEANEADPMRVRMDAYGEVVKRLAKDYDAVFIKVQEAFDDYLEHRPTQSLCGDRVHPNRSGHTVIARAFLKALEFDWNGEDEF